MGTGKVCGYLYFEESKWENPPKSFVQIPCHKVNMDKS